MKAELKQKWIDALRSGAYEQAPHALCNRGGAQVGYCCLGVLICVSGEIRVPNEIFGGTLAGPGRMHLLGNDRKLESNLIGMNDSGGYSFADIADYIEQYVPADA